jgi:putative sterol carrier protein
MARFLTQEWIDEFNAALEGVVLPLPGPEGGLAAADGSFVVVEEVHDAPDGDIRVTLRADAGRIQFSRRAIADAAAGPDQDDGAGEAADVTIVLSYRDAVALSSGELTPAQAIGAGRIRVRGDLAVLMSAQSMLDAARERTAELAAATTY